MEKPLYFGYVKAMFNAMGFLCIAIGTLFLFGTAPILKFVPFIVLAFAMLTYPSQSVSSDEEIGLGMMKMIMGFVMVVIFSFFTFRDLMGMQLLLWISLSSIAAAFFICIPVLEVEGDGIGAGAMKKMQNVFKKAGELFGENIMKKVDEEKRGSFLGKILKWFIYLMIIGFVFSIGLEIFSSFAVTDYAIGSVSMGIAPFLGLVLCVFSVYGGFKLRNKMNTVNPMLMGIFGGIGLLTGSFALMNNIVSFIVFALVVGFGVLVSMPVDKAKPFIGIPILLIALATTTIAYPDVMGESVFGIWWPTIDYNIDATIGPILDNIQSPMSTLGQGYGCLINPQACYADFQPQTSTKESIKSVEVTQVESITISKIEEETNYFMVIATVENRGKEDAENIRIVPKELTYAQGIQAEAAEEIDGSVEIRCPNSSVGDSCVLDKLITGEIRELIMTYTIDNTDKLDPGNYVSVGLDIEYDIDIMGQVDVMVMDEDYYLKLSKNKELQISEQITEDTGGPVRMGLALMRNQMPVRDNLEGVPVLLSLTNQGPGIVEKVINAKIDISDIEEIPSACDKHSSGDYYLDGLDAIMEPGDEEDKLESGESVKAVCTSRVPDINVEQKTFAITGTVKYTYSSGKGIKIPIEFISEEDDGAGGGGTGDEDDYGDDDSGTEDDDTDDSVTGCTDSDGGENYFYEGTVTNESETHRDSCIRTETLTEYYCDGGKIKSREYDCPNGCVMKETDGVAIGVCNGGNHEEDFCTDEDGGLDYFTSASTGGVLDTCKDSDKLEEGYCNIESGMPIYVEYTCPNGCESGACRVS